LNRRKVTILSYHSVLNGDEPTCVDPYKQHIPLRLFQQHLDYLQQNRKVISLSEFLNAKREHLRLPNYSVVLTFEDGFEDFYTVAASQLAQRKLAATVFIITDRADGRLPPNGESFLSWQQVQELASCGIEIGSHTCSHPRLPELPLEEVRRELADSRATIIAQLNPPDVPLSFPYGRTSESISQLAQSLGYSCAITGTLGHNDRETDNFALHRTTIASDDDLATFAARVSGLTWWISILRRFILGAENRNELQPDCAVSAAGWLPLLFVARRAAPALALIAILTAILTVWSIRPFAPAPGYGLEDEALSDTHDPGVEQTILTRKALSRDEVFSIVVDRNEREKR
jgi:peptidoglycan/xylan/chitin deacetylase (PgdA/CDA1 family)